MQIALPLQYLVIVIAVLLSLWVVLNQKLPGTLRRFRVALAITCLREGRAPWLARMGRRLAPAARNDESACGACTGCGPSK